MLQMIFIGNSLLELLETLISSMANIQVGENLH